MARSDDEDKDPALGSRGSAAARTARLVGHGSSGGHAPATRSVAAAARQALRQPPLDFDHRHHPVQQQRARPVEYAEYPKAVYPGAKDPSRPYDDKGKPLPFVRVNNREEEDLVMGGDPIVREDDERKRLIKVAEVKGVRIDKRWNSDNLRAAIIGAGFDAELNPFA